MPLPLAVFLFHTWEFAGHPQIPVVAAVVGANIRPDFFVVLTGFVLYLPFVRDSKRFATFQPRAYLERRLRRIVLPYYVALGIAILLPQTLVIIIRTLGHDASWQALPSIADLFAHLTFTHLFFFDYWSSINGSLWTMSLEMQLYFIFPVLILSVRRYGAPILWGAAALSVVYLICVKMFVDGPGYPDQFLWSASGMGRLVEFAAGMLAAQIALTRSRTTSLPGAAILMGAIAASFVFATAPVLNQTFIPVREVGLSFMFGTLIFLTITVPAIGCVFAWRPVSGLGFRAYSMFLVHQPVAWYFAEALKKFLGFHEGVALLLVLWTLGLLVVLAVGQVLFIVVERPCIDWAKRTSMVGRSDITIGA